MKIKVKIDNIGETFDSLVENGLKSKKLPSCLGKMIPPILEKVVEFDSDRILTIRGTVPPTDIVIEDVTPFIKFDTKNIKNERHNRDFVLTKEGMGVILDYKKRRSLKYINQVSKCVSCEHTDICFKLTFNYLKLISLNV